MRAQAAERDELARIGKFADGMKAEADEQPIAKARSERMNMVMSVEVIREFGCKGCKPLVLPTPHFCESRVCGRCEVGGCGSREPVAYAYGTKTF